MPIGAMAQQQLDECTGQLLLHTPVQYVLHEAWFAGLKFYVDENVLIPRPETEELVFWIADWTTLGEQSEDKTDHKTKNKQQKKKSLKLLDIGTGSGCIPIALKKKLGDWDVHALEAYAGALQVAKKNAATLQTPITFYAIDILTEADWKPLPTFDIIVSNPPYIRQGEAATMPGNVTRFEPHSALFVPDDDPLLFYKKIADFALLHLYKDGVLFFEINESLGSEVCGILAEKGFVDIVLKKDMQGKERMVRATAVIN
jgi:release factor glutamine methyltransferase